MRETQREGKYNVDPYENVDVIGADVESFKVEKFRFGDDKSTIIYNSKVKITNIPEKAYEYEINGRSAMGWDYGSI